MFIGFYNICVGNRYWLGEIVFSINQFYKSFGLQFRLWVFIFSLVSLASLVLWPWVSVYSAFNIHFHAFAFSPGSRFLAFFSCPYRYKILAQHSSLSPHPYSSPTVCFKALVTSFLLSPIQHPIPPLSVNLHVSKIFILTSLGVFVYQLFGINCLKRPYFFSST